MPGEFIPNMDFFNRLEKASGISLAKAAEAIKTNLITSQTMPFDTGTLQNFNTFVVSEPTQSRIVTQGPQARRLYFHPEYNYQKGKNPNASGRWLDPYLAGHEKGNEFRESYAKFLKREMGG